MVARRQLARLVAVCVLVAQAGLAPVAGVALASGRDTARRAPASSLAPGSAGVPPTPVPPGTAGILPAPADGQHTGTASILPAPVVFTGSARAYGDTPLHQPAFVPPGTAGILPAPVGRRAARGPDAARPATLPAASSKPSRRAAPAALTLTLASMPAHPVALRIEQVMATLSRPVSDGTITFSLRRPTVTGALYSCTPVHGRCAMMWSAHNAGAVTIAAHWPGDRHYHSADATLTITVSRAAYSDSGTWQGRRVGPLTRVAPTVNVPRLPGATRAGQLTRFHSDDPAYRCLDGKSLAVYTTPRAYPDDYVAYSEGRGSACAAGTWLYPQGTGVSTRRALSGAAGRDIVVPGAFPASRPSGAVVQLYGHGGSLVATVSVRAWSSRAVTVRVPASLDTGAYTLRVSWYDRLTGTAVRGSALIIHISAPRHSAPVTTSGVNPPATDIPVAPGPPVLPAVPTTRPRPAFTSTAIPTTAANPPPTATSAPPPATGGSNPPAPAATSVPAPPPPATSAPAPASTSTPVPPATAVPTDTPTSTATPMSTPIPSSTVTPTSTSSPTPTSTPLPSATATLRPLPPTSTRVPSLTPTATATPNPSATSTATAPALPSLTSTATSPSPISTATTTGSPTTSPTATPTETATPSPSGTATASPTGTTTATPTGSATATTTAGCTTTLPSSITSDTELTASPCGTYTSNGTTVQSGATLTVDPGVVIQFGGSGLVVQGALRGAGTASAPITLTGTSDTPGAWSGLDAEPGSAVALSYATVSNAAHTNCYYSSCGALYLNGSAVSLDHVTVTRGAYGGILVVGGGRLTISDSTISHNASDGIYLADSSGPIPTVSITDTRFLANGGYGLHLANPNVTPGLANNIFQGNTNFDGVYLDGGTLTRSATWLPDWGPVEVGGSLTISGGAALTMTAGLSVSVGGGGALDVQGILRAMGTASAPITLTSTVASLGLGSWWGVYGEPGATVALDYTTVADAENGAGFHTALFLRSSTASLDHTTVTRSIFDGIGVTDGGRLSIHDSTITHVSTAIRVDHATVSIHNSVIADDSYGISNCSGCTPVQAQNNYWGTPSGPAPYGSGPGISYHQESYTDPNTGQTYSYNVPDVAVEPWLGESTALQQQNGPAGNSGSGAGGSSGTAGFGRSGSSTDGGFDAGSAINDTVSFGEPVNTATGSYEYSHTDLSLGGRTPLVFARGYNSRTAAAAPGPLGYGWTWTYGVSLTTAMSGSTPTVQVTFGTGRADVFTGQPDGTYAAAPGQFDALTANADGSYDVTDKDRTVYHFSSGGALQSITDRNGNVTALGYNGGGQLTTVSAAGARALALSYNGDGRIASVADNSGRAIAFGYSPAGDLTSLTDPRGHTTSYAYDAGHQLTGGVDRDGHSFVTNQYDALDAGRVITQTDALGNVTTFAYYLAPPNSVTVATDPRGAATTYTYDSQYRLVGVRDAANGTTSYTYDDRGDRLTATDPNNHTSTYTYDTRGNTLSATDPRGATTTYSYDAVNRPLTVVDPLTHAITSTYDLHENPRTRIDALGATTAYTYTAQGDLSRVTDALGHTTVYSYDAAGGRTAATDALGHTTGSAYDAVGRTVAVTDALGHAATLGYDAADDVITRTDALGHSTLTAYDAEGNRLGVTNPRGYVTAYGYDADNRLITVTDALSGTTVYGYDEVGDRTAVTDALTYTTTTAYDLLGRVTSVTSPLSETVSYGYDAAGNRTSVVNARGHTTTYSYDEDNRLTGIVYAGGASVSYSYDAAGRRAGMTDATGATSYSYDADNRVTRIVQPNGTVGYSYDADGHRTSVTAPGGKTAAYAYDAANRLAGVTDWRGGVTAYGYDAAGRTGAITYTNGVSAAYSYNDAGQLLGLTYQRGGATLATFSYSYDRDGNRLTATDGGGTTTYGYDALDRLTLAQAPGGATGYTYDAAGNRTGVTTPGGTTAYSYNAANELTAAGATTYSYDADGNRLTATTGGATTTYGYDDANYLTGLASGAHGMVYTYNGDHARVASAVDGVTTSDVLDLAAGLPTVLQQVTSGVTTTYLYGAGLLGQDDGTELLTLLPDALGSTRLVAGSGGAVVGHSSYDAYGAQTTSGAGSVFGFTGQQTDAASGLVYLRARYYDPATGVFLQRDPYPFDPNNPTTVDRYLYVGDNPTNRIDPSGFVAQCDQSAQTHGEVLGAATGPESESNPFVDWVDFIGKFVPVPDPLGTYLDRREVTMTLQKEGLLPAIQKAIEIEGGNIISKILPEGWLQIDACLLGGYGACPSFSSTSSVSS